jgi:WhiB family redox-sensing transcriptional regulator
VNVPNPVASPARAGWRGEAACRNLPTATFFPLPGDTVGTLAAKAICRCCSVWAACLADALADPMRHGVWGGLTGEERARRRGTARAL